MATRYTALVGAPLTLEALFSLNSAATDVFEIDRVELLNADLEVVDTVDGEDVVQVSTGRYSATFPALTEGGELSDHWIYRPVEDAELQTLVLSVVVGEFSGSAPELGAPEDDTDLPDIPMSQVCVVTHTFFDAGGKHFKGVYVRFRPSLMPTQALAAGTPARDVTTSSDEHGEVTLYLPRGMRGMLTISGIGLVREVTVPDVAAADLFDLIATSDDLYEVQKMDNFIDLPRES